MTKKKKRKKNNNNHVFLSENIGRLQLQREANLQFRKN